MKERLERAREFSIHLDVVKDHAGEMFDLLVELEEGREIVEKIDRITKESIEKGLKTKEDREMEGLH